MDKQTKSEVEELVELLRDSDWDFITDLAKIIISAGYRKSRSNEAEIEKYSQLYEEGYEKGKNWVINNPKEFGLSSSAGKELVEINRMELAKMIGKWAASGRDYSCLIDDLCSKFGTKPQRIPTFEEMNKAVDEAIADAFGYYKDPKGVIDIAIKTIKEMLEKE